MNTSSRKAFRFDEEQIDTGGSVNKCSRRNPQLPRQANGSSTKHYYYMLTKLGERDPVAPEGRGNWVMFEKENGDEIVQERLLRRDAGGLLAGVVNLYGSFLYAV